jgi:hypothetical protein
MIMAHCIGTTLTGSVGMDGQLQTKENHYNNECREDINWSWIKNTETSTDHPMKWRMISQTHTKS